MLTLGFIKMSLSVRDNAFSFMLMRKDSNLFLKLKSQSTELDNKNLPLNNMQIICKQNLTGALHDPDFEECQVKGTVYWQKKIELKAILNILYS